MGSYAVGGVISRITVLQILYYRGLIISQQAAHETSSRLALTISKTDVPV